VTEFVSAVPTIPAREIEASAAWYRDRLGFEVFHDGNLVTFFEVPS
jgi:catechol 2,3-dioxygenase-like lactoylglutathione lyase family enzyme